MCSSADAKFRTTKFSSEALDGNSTKFAPAKISCYTVYVTNYVYHYVIIGKHTCTCSFEINTMYICMFALIVAESYSIIRLLLYTVKLTTVFTLIECKLKNLTLARFSGKGCHLQIHYEKSQNANFLALTRSCVL